jgi:hypothetical protein
MARDEESKAGIESSQQPGNAGSSKQEESPTGTFKRPRSEGSTPTEMARTLKRPRDQYKGSYLQGYPEDKLTEDDQDSIL